MEHHMTSSSAAPHETVPPIRSASGSESAGEHEHGERDRARKGWSQACTENPRAAWLQRHQIGELSAPKFGGQISGGLR
jgi:hypothetical protein